ncbi:hypothetical protein MC885_021813, partial [Smutsia gigantea]
DLILLHIYIGNGQSISHSSVTFKARGSVRESLLLCVSVFLDLACKKAQGDDGRNENPAGMHDTPGFQLLESVLSFIRNLNSQVEETGEFREEEFITRRKFLTALDGFSLEAMLTIYQLQKICHSRAFQHWELIQEDVLDTGNDKNEKEEVIKRKIPYILKRQLYENKPRRPYILKRGSYYY